MAQRIFLQQVLSRAEHFVEKGCRSIFEGDPSEKYLLSPCPVSTALAAMALMGESKSVYKKQVKKALKYLERHRNPDRGWGRTPGVPSDERSTEICRTALKSGDKGLTEESIQIAISNIAATWMQDVPEMILKLSPNSRLMNMLEYFLLGKAGSIPFTDISFKRLTVIMPFLPPSARPMIISLSSLREMGRRKVSPALQPILEKLVNFQTPNGTWCEDILITSLSILCLYMARQFPSAMSQGLKWLASVQYPSGAWPSFNQVTNWDIGFTAFVLGEKGQQSPLIAECGHYLASGANSDGSFGTLSPYSFPDFDDTAACLLGLATASSSTGMHSEVITKTRELLLKLQNRDGSWGSFPEIEGLPPECTSKLPVHTKSVDVTVHVLRALLKSGSDFNSSEVKKGLAWLESVQKLNGSWNSTWYTGSTFATAQVLEVLADGGIYPSARLKARNWLIRAQHTNGSWPVKSVGECALASIALLKNQESPNSAPIQKALKYIRSSQQKNGSFKPAYGGVYFSSLYYEAPMAECLAAIRAIKTYLFFNVLKGPKLDNPHDNNGNGQGQG